MNSIHGFPPGLPPAPFGGPGRSTPAEADAGGVSPRPAQVSPAMDQAGTPDVARVRESVPPEPPPGTDPELWTILTAEERSFFSRASAMGPLTYGPGAPASTNAPALAGGRIDLRV